ncbi:MAG: translation initiation factor IF-2 subunit gamma [Candidatus Thermoplasmatota archaeon]|nr:translation initiation factor IF-2 subunit gamma [Candidatus Thermoplasmatota archaeon]
MRSTAQPQVNIGLVGHVDHGKTTLTEALSGVWTDTHSEEIKRGITIKLGYADAVFYKCPKCPEPECYSVEETCPVCGDPAEFKRAVSFVDAPGHETLMATMLAGSALMNGALLLIAANEKCPQPQTREHLMALGFIGITNIIIVQTKIDIVTKERALESRKEIEKFVKGTVAENAPVIPVSAHFKANLDLLIQTIEDRISSIDTDLDLPNRMYIARSFDVNKPGTPFMELKGGVLGGTLVQGTIREGDPIEIRPGIKVEVKGTSNYEFVPIYTKATSLMSGGCKRDSITPGGLAAIGTALDPFLTKSDSLIGNVLGKPGTLPPVVEKLLLKTHLMDFLVGVDESTRVDRIKTSEVLMLNVGTATTVGIVTSAHDDVADMNLRMPICAEKDQRAAISRRVGNKFRLIGYGIIQ